MCSDSTRSNEYGFPAHPWAPAAQRNSAGCCHSPVVPGLQDLCHEEGTKSAHFASTSFPAASSRRQTCIAAHTRVTRGNSEKRGEKKKKKHPEKGKSLPFFPGPPSPPPPGCLKILGSSDNSSIWWQWSVPWVLLSGVPRAALTAQLLLPSSPTVPLCAHKGCSCGSITC